ncbi:MAG: CehA/McbA family metallohydrolase [Candidatus Hydrogenedentes bacterium]|nr:CehA/McbA family metallohydrolase [Candidatus Hydrogenedentota bacterium]
MADGEKTEPMGTLSIRVVDAAAGTETPARVHLTDLDGKTVKVTEFPWWHDHFVVPGGGTLSLPESHYHAIVERGAEYRAARADFSIRGNQTTEVAVTTDRFVDVQAAGWWPGDLHVHRPPEDIELLMRAEDVHVAPVITWWNTKNYWSNRSVPNDPSMKFDDNRFYHLMAGEDEREGGAFLYFNGTSPVDLSMCDKEWPSPLTILADAKRANSGLWIDIEKPFWWDVPTAIAQGLCDSIGIANNHMCRRGMYESEAWGKRRDTARLPRPRGNGYWSQEIYYELLSSGIRIAPSAGSASGVLPNPVGYNRVYVHLDGALQWDAWWEGLRAGRSFVTNGPMLFVKANGEIPGHVFQSGEPIDIAITAEILTQDTIPYVEVIKNGAIDHTVPFEEWKRTGSLGALRFDECGWFIVRAVTDNSKTFRFASTAPYYVEVGERKERISRASAQFFLDWVRERIARIKHDDPRKLEEVLAPHRDAERFWSRRVKQANAP